MNIKFIEHKKHIIFLGLITIIVTILFSNGLHAPFFFDGEAKIKENKDIRKISFYKLFKPYQRAQDYFDRNDPMRALTFFTFMLNYKIGKLNVEGYHIFNILIHILVCFVLYFLIIKILSLENLKIDKQKLSFLVVLFFAVHPANSEVVTYIYQRSESLAALFSFLSLYAFTNYATDKNYKYIFWSLIFLFFGLFAKQSAVITIPLIFTIHFVFLADNKMKNFIRKLYILTPYIFVFLSFEIIRILLKDTGQTKAMFKWTNLSYLATQPYVICNYIIKTFIPFKLCAHHILDPFTNYFSINFILPVIAITLFLTLIIFLIIQNKNKVKLFAISWFFIALLPTSSFIPLTTAMAERRMYAAMPGLILFLFLCLYTKKIRYKVIYTVSIILIPYLMFMTYSRNEMYNNPQALWNEVASIYKEHIGVNSRLGSFHYERGEFEQALHQFEKGLQKDPYNIALWQRKAQLLYAQAKYKQAIECYDKIITINPDFAEAYKEKANTLYSMGKKTEALETYFIGLKLFGTDIETLNNIGAIYKDNKDYQNAIKYLLLALETDKTYVNANFNLANAYLDLHQYEDALKHYNMVLNENPKHLISIQNSGWIYTQKIINPKKTIELYSKLLKLQPNIKQKKNILSDIGISYTLLKNFDEASKYLQQAIETDPYFFEAKFNLAITQHLAGENNQAIEMLKNIISEFPEKEITYIRLITIYTDLKMSDEAMKLYKNFKNNFPTKIQFLKQMETILKVDKE